MDQPEPKTASDLLDAMLAHVPFDGWSAASLSGAAEDIGIDAAEARGLAPRGAVGMAALWHRQADARMAERLAATDQTALRFRDRVALAVRLRLEVADREVVRRGAALFALPQNAAEGSRLIWGTADAIWTALGDTSDDVNWYTKRLSLAGVYASVVLYWLGDGSDGAANTWAFLDRRIDNVMRIETAKAGLRKNPLVKGALDSKLNPFTWIRAPASPPREYPGTRSDHDAA